MSASIFQSSVYYVNEIIAAAKVTRRRRIVKRLALLVSYCFLKILTAELRNMIQNNGLCDRRQTEYKAGALSLHILLISGRCRITWGLFDDTLTNGRHGVEWCDTEQTSKYAEGKNIGLIWYKIQVLAIFDIWRKTTKGLSVVGLLAEFLTMDLQNTKQRSLPRDHNLLWVGADQSLLICVRF